MATKKKTTAPALTDPNAIYQQLAAMPMGGATPLDQTYANAVSRYRKASDATYVLPDVLKSYLGGVSPAYTQDKAAVLAQFADKNSPLYISNPFARLQAAQAANQGQKQTYDQVLERTSRLVGMGVSQQERGVQDLGNQIQGIQQAQKDQRSALQQQFNNALNLAQEARARASAGGSGAGKDRLLTFSEAKALNKPIGTKLSDVLGMTVPAGLSGAQKDLKGFVDTYSQRNKLSIDPNSPKANELYQDYVDANDAINSDPNPLQKYKELVTQFPDLRGVIEAPRSLSYAELLNQQVLQSVQ